MDIKQSQGYGLTERDITDEQVFQQRRQLLKNMGYIGAGGLLAMSQTSQAGVLDWFGKKSAPKTLFKQSPLSFNSWQNDANDAVTLEQKATGHNNFYEFGTKKSQPSELAQNFNVNPWQLTISGEVNNPITLDYDDLFKRFALQQRIYRLRCVETWSMVIPWIGFELASLLKQAEPTSKARYVAFETLYDPKQMPGQKSRYIGGGIEYPYVEGLRLDEAMNPLTLLSVGMYGKTLPPQNGAPIRLVVPWKYGFKSIKSIVSIKLVEHQPPTTWNKLLANEYGFYANVNPDVAHPRWSQASERRITKGGLLEQKRIATLPFNGYAEQVAHLYKNMDLAKYY